MKNTMACFALTRLVSLMIIGGMLASCQLFDHDNDTLTAPTSEGEQTGNFIIGDPEISGWGGYYHRNNAFFAINAPVVGALNISYTIQNGGGYALFVETTGATKMEIGLNTINGVTDELDSVCVSYAEGVTAFASVPAGVVKAKQRGATHYRRKHDAGESDWWPLDAAFAFGVAEAQVKTVCVMQNGALGVTEISGPFPKAAPALACAFNPANPCQVSSSADNGARSLRGVLELGACATITFECGVTKITLTNGRLTVGKNTIIDGGSHGVTISGNHASSIFYINEGVTVELKHLTIQDGNASGPDWGDFFGGGIQNLGTLTLDRATIVQNNSAQHGGGIANAHILTVHGIVRGNTAVGMSDGYAVPGNGGGIWNMSSNGLTISATAKITGNTAQSGTADPGVGGGIYSSDQLNVSVNGAVNGNVAEECANYFNAMMSPSCQLN